MRASNVLLVLCAISIAPVAGALAQSSDAIKIGEVRTYQAETPHPYPPGSELRPVVWREKVNSPGAEFLRIHLSGLALAAGDKVTVSNAEGTQVRTYEGRGPNGDGDVWTFGIDGDTAIVELYSRGGGGPGFRIDAIGHGTSPLGRTKPGPSPMPLPETICGGNGLEDVACLANDTVFNGDQPPVARLSIVQDSGTMVFCTGWLVNGTKADMMMTNYHCAHSRKEVHSIQADFDLQFTTCGGSIDAPVSTYAGSSLLQTNSDTVDSHGNGGLDYTLFTLGGSPGAVWGMLTPTVRGITVGDLMGLIGHPAGAEKKDSKWEDSTQTSLCQILLVDRTYVNSAPGTQVSYTCDTQPGSSGSPVIDPSSGNVFALHHFGGVTDPPYTCLNAATEMSQICADAASLLNCVSN